VPRLRNALIHSFQSSVRMLPFQPGLQPNSQGSSRPAPPGFAIFKIHNTHGPNPASFKRLYRKRPGGRIHLLPSGPDTPGRFRYSSNVYQAGSGSEVACLQ